jgi:threonine dehydrogenase-like Zn-dependent dehydrogenase
MLEPSAGIGGLALFGKAAGAKVVVNELDPRRLDILKEMPFDGFYKEDGEQINNILPKTVKPTVVIMNPPFSTAATRGVTATANSFRHVDQALKRLQPGGRLVAVLGLSKMGGHTKGFTDWIKQLQTEYNVRAAVGIDGKNYKKYGTSFDVQYLVIDKTEPTDRPLIRGVVKTLDEVIQQLGDVECRSIRKRKSSF